MLTSMVFAGIAERILQKTGEDLTSGAKLSEARLCNQDHQNNRYNL